MSDAFSGLSKLPFVMSIAKGMDAPLLIKESYSNNKSNSLVENKQDIHLKYFLSMVEHYGIPTFLNLESNSKDSFNKRVNEYESSKKKPIDNLLVISNGVVKSEKDWSIIAFDNGFSIVFEDFYNNPLMFQREEHCEDNTGMLKIFGNNKTPLAYIKIPSLARESKLIKIEYDAQNTYNSYNQSAIMVRYLNI